VSSHHRTLSVMTPRTEPMTKTKYPKPTTPRRSFRIKEPLWRKALAKAHENGETVTDAVTRFLQEYTR